MCCKEWREMPQILLIMTETELVHMNYCSSSLIFIDGLCINARVCSYWTVASFPAGLWNSEKWAEMGEEEGDKGGEMFQFTVYKKILMEEFF